MMYHILCLSVLLLCAEAFNIQQTPIRCQSSRSSTAVDNKEDDAAIQWELFTRHHARGSWKGVWTTYDYIGDVIDETIASVNLDVLDTPPKIQQSHTIVIGATKSDCATCFDSHETKTFPVATYTPQSLRQARLASCGMINGPTVLPNGVMSTELVLSYKDARVRVVFQHAPVWERGIEPGNGPPQGLKLFRTLISREALRDAPPTAETEASLSDATAPIFFRPVPPFNWHKKWTGTSWTWGPQSGNKGWALDDLDETDSWHGVAPVEYWNLRLPGGIFVQTDRVLTDASTGICRLAWLPTDEVLLRMEAGIQVLQPLYLGDDAVVGFAPPSLVSLRCDSLQKTGELDTKPSFANEQEKPLSDNEAFDKRNSNASNTTGLSSSTGLDDDILNSIKL